MNSTKEQTPFCPDCGCVAARHDSVLKPVGGKAASLDLPIAHCVTHGECWKTKGSSFVDAVRASIEGVVAAPILESGSKYEQWAQVRDKTRIKRGNFEWCLFNKKGAPATEWESVTVETLVALNSYSPEREALLAQLVRASDQLLGFLNVTPLRLSEGDSMTLSMLTSSVRAALTEYEKQKQST